ncbi:MAG: PQQ-dependent sugar dehydrogenase [Chitinophagaceae bacterium]|nr:PQQ-dependent sugar dehydrogenase [Chitinophagaceae bacterium]
MFLRIAVYLLALSSIACNKKSSNNNPPDDDTTVEITHRVLTPNLNFPWQLLWGPDNMLWMSERGGRISRVDPGTGEVLPVTTISEVVSQGEGGMLGMALLRTSGMQTTLYVAYDYMKNGEYTGKVVRFDYSNGSLTNPFTIVDDLDAAGIHNGCRLLIFPGDQKLYITTGDASDQSSPQNLDSRNGKILRVNLDGSIPSDNPDPSSPVWSFGHRNPQGLVFVGDIIFSSEHGPDSDDEINIIEKGKNYGWPNVRGLCDESDEQTFCNDNDVTEPIKQWTPTIAVCGIDYYDRDSIPQWNNSILMATLKNQRLMQLKLSEDHRSIVDTEEFLVNEYGRLRDVCVAPDGRVFVCTSNGGGDDVIVEVKKQ